MKALALVAALFLLAGCSKGLGREDAAAQLAPKIASNQLKGLTAYRANKSPPALGLMDVTQKDDPKWPAERAKLIADFHAVPSAEEAAKTTETFREGILKESYKKSDTEWFGEENQTMLRCVIKAWRPYPDGKTFEDLKALEAEAKTRLEVCIGHPVVDSP